ncbi:uncharacterized protein EI90DRAFT_3119805 [Cantharellus anzutake]|uniref:uncharacterized protein n=1 Tax=Cantharellus anzutake TaxID=1750568 RepID=UPI0019034CE6|nr:uncharacterized protein EI90DRAFT_3119805 [Cantharellus anzutake]KAF8336551.1 hypothetical protein EI90DRAFT_3119805 [Cantharellus anzutake]
MRCLFHILGDFVFLGGIILHLYAYLSPVPWFLNDTTYEEPPGYTPLNDCDGGVLPRSTLHIVSNSQPLPRDEPLLRFKRFAEPSLGVAKRESNTANYSQAAIWIGPLGSCNRDVDGKVYCTKPSYSNPQYNLTHITHNSVFYPSMMPDVIIHRCIILATLSLDLVGYILSILASVPFWFPGLYISLCGPNDVRDPVPVASACVVGGYFRLSLGTQNFFIRVTRINKYNTVGHFYDNAPCGQLRTLKPGILLKATEGKMYKVIWAGWCLIFLSKFFFVARAKWLKDKYDGQKSASTSSE